MVMKLSALCHGIKGKKKMVSSELRTPILKASEEMLVHLADLKTCTSITN